MNIAGILLHAHPGRRARVRDQLVAIDGLEIHAVTEDGRFVITLEDEDAERIGDTVVNLHHLDGVLSAAMVYQYGEPGE